MELFFGGGGVQLFKKYTCESRTNSDYMQRRYSSLQHCLSPSCAWLCLLYLNVLCLFLWIKGLLNHWIRSEDDTFYYKISVVCLTSWFLFKSVYDDWSLNQSGTLLLVYSLAFSFRFELLSCMCSVTKTFTPLPNLHSTSCIF